MVTRFAGTTETGAATPALPHLKFIDGLRGAAALYVVLHHSCNLSFIGVTEPKGLFFLSWGHAAVTVFIAISGYCLALPVVRSNLRLKGGAMRFYRKRARRILPPYYAALAMGIMLFVFVWTPSGARIGLLSQPLIERALLTHLLMVHNWSPSLAYMFDGPLWSVAMEMQIYLLFPLMVVVWRRFGTIWMLAGSFVLGHAVFLLTGHQGPANYLFIFALGAWAAELSLKGHNIRLLKVIFYTSAGVFFLFPSLHVVYSDMLVGVGISSLMVLSARSLFWPRSILGLGFFTWLGGFSYSIYLIHDVLQHFFFTTALRPSWLRQGMPILLFFGFAITPIILGLSYLFHLAIERPFMTVHSASGPVQVPHIEAPPLNPEEISAQRY